MSGGHCVGVKVFKPPIKARIVTNGRCLPKQAAKKTLIVGSKKHIYQSLVQFDISTLPLFLTILNGTLHLYLLENDWPSIEKTISVHQILSSWSKRRCLCINTLPIASTTFSNINHSFISFDITPLVTAWYTGSAENLGILLKLSNELTSGYVELCSNKFHNSAFWPSLEVSILEPLNPSEACCQTLDFDISVTTDDIIKTTAILNIQHFNYTYYVINTGVCSATVSLQLSPDGTNWLIDEPPRVITPGIIVPLVPNVIARFARITYQSAISHESTKLDIRVRGFSS